MNAPHEALNDSCRRCGLLMPVRKLLTLSFCVHNHGSTNSFVTSQPKPFIAKNLNLGDEMGGKPFDMKKDHRPHADRVPFVTSPESGDVARFGQKVTKLQVSHWFWFSLAVGTDVKAHVVNTRN